jgi:hypothetical protein
MKFAARRAALPGNVVSFVLCPSAPPLGRCLRGTLRPEPLEGGHDGMLWGALAGIKNQGPLWTWDSFRRSLKGRRSKASPTRPSLQSHPMPHFRSKSSFVKKKGGMPLCAFPKLEPTIPSIHHFFKNLLSSFIAAPRGINSPGGSILIYHP